MRCATASELFASPRGSFDLRDRIRTRHVRLRRLLAAAVAAGVRTAAALALPVARLWLAEQRDAELPRHIPPAQPGVAGGVFVRLAAVDALGSGRAHGGWRRGLARAARTPCAAAAAATV